MDNRAGGFGPGSWILLAGLGWAASACGSGRAEPGDPPGSDGVVTELRSDVSRVVPDGAEAARAGRSEREFGFELLQVLDADKNIAFSPHSLSTAFAMATDAALGDTLDEISSVFRFGVTDEAFHRSQDALALGLAARNRPALKEGERDIEAQVLTQSNDIWTRDDAPPEASFLDVLARYYGVGVHQADFGTHWEEARLAINAKVSDDTHALIPELLPEGVLDEFTVAVLTNALYFKAPWQKPFGKPVPGTFHRLDGSTSTPEVMAIESTFAYTAGDGFQALSVPYYGAELELMLIVPAADKYEAVRRALSADVLEAAIAARAATYIALTLPKFDVKSTVEAKQALEDLGMETPFSRELADFPKLKSAILPQVYVSDVLHQATVAIDEKGTEASAATAVVLGGVTSAPPTPLVVNVDRPFLFVIRDNPTGSLLFVGQVVDP